MIRIGICDDLNEALLAHKIMIQSILEKMGLNGEVKCFQSGEELLCELEQKGGNDFIFMDIEMTGMNGIEVAKIIRETDYSVTLIFISSHDQYCREMISVQPFAFLEKPVSEEALEKVFVRALKVRSCTNEETFTFTYNRTLYKVLMRQILYFESDKRAVNLYTADDRKTFYRKLDEVEKELNQSDIKFIRVNKSYLVNTLYIKEFRYDNIVMSDGKVTNIGTKYKDQVRDYYMKSMRMK